jgi:hypothetical protein
VATNNLTITGKIGPGNTVTSLLFANVTDVDFQVARGVLQVSFLTSGGQPKTQSFDLAQSTTVTYSISGGVATITVS